MLSTPSQTRGDTYGSGAQVTWAGSFGVGLLRQVTGTSCRSASCHTGARRGNGPCEPHAMEASARSESGSLRRVKGDGVMVVPSSEPVGPEHDSQRVDLPAVLDCLAAEADLAFDGAVG